MTWFEVDKEGLAQLVADRGKVFILHELLQNAWDAPGVTKVSVHLEPLANRPLCQLLIEDDSPTGWVDLTHAYTVFAPSAKKSDPTKRGMFNFGEKLVLALCESAEIITTTGSIRFNQQGRTKLRRRLESGSRFVALIRMTRAEYEQVYKDILRIIPPPNITTTFNGSTLTAPEAIRTFTAKLPTIVANGDGVPRRVERDTEVRLHPTGPDEVGTLYEMGIPVVEIGDTFHVDVQQKVPLNMQRDNVPPSYLRAIRVAVVNNTADLITPERAATTEVQEATSDPRATPEAVAQMMTKRFGEKRFTFDPTDLEANNHLTAEGFTPISGGSLTAGQWENVRRLGLSQAAGTLRPTPQCYSAGGKTEEVIPSTEYTEGMKRTVKVLQRLAQRLIPVNVNIKIVRVRTAWWAANYGGGWLTLNLMKLGHRFFDEFPDNMDRVLDLLIHELAHHYESNHLSEGYYEALSSLGGRLAALAIREPRLFDPEQ